MEGVLEKCYGKEDLCRDYTLEETEVEGKDEHVNLRISRRPSLSRNERK